MKIQPTQITHSGPGIDLSDYPEGLSVQMADPVEDLEYARNALTLTFDLTGYEHVRLAFEAMEFGDEPHAPPSGPFGDDVDFDGVAVSAGGAVWYEVQELRSLRSDKFTPFDLDLDAAVAALGISYNGAFRVRFCQYDNNPIPMDGFSIQKIELKGDLRPPILHLTMDDNTANPTVLDASEGHHNQTFVDPGGNPNTSAHTVAGKVGTALSFDGVDDKIRCGTDFMNDVLASGRDWTIAFWWKPTSGAGGSILLNSGSVGGDVRGFNIHTYWTSYISMWLYFEGATEKHVSSPWQDINGWHHYAFVRCGDTLEAYTDGVLGNAFSDPAYSGSLANPAEFQIGDTSASALDDFRVYDRALLESEIQGLALAP